MLEERKEVGRDGLSMVNHIVGLSVLAMAGIGVPACSGT